MKYEVRLSGEGGQGLILAGKILAEAAAIHAGLNATQSQSYGPEARGGASRSEVILSDGEIDYPKATEVDLMVALTQQSYDTYRADVKRDGVVIVDSEAVERLGETWYRVIAQPIFRLSEENFGRILFGNVCTAKRHNNRCRCRHRMPNWRVTWGWWRAPRASCPRRPSRRRS